VAGESDQQEGRRENATIGCHFVEPEISAPGEDAKREDSSAPIPAAETQTQSENEKGNMN
jgi:hypothetical protein